MEQGLSSSDALDILLEESRSVSSKHGAFDFKDILRNCLHPSASLFPITNIFWASLSIVALSLSEESVYAYVLSVLFIINILLVVSESLLASKEISKRAQHVLDKVSAHRKDILEWSKDNYPRLNTPYSSSIKLQWTKRDNVRVNLPWSLLVKGDLIYLRPGQEAPGLCQSISYPNLTLSSDEVFQIKSNEDSSKSSLEPEFRAPISPAPFRLLETPYTEQLKLIFKADKSQKFPTSLLYKYASFLFIQIPCHRILPVSSLLYAIVVLIHWNLGFENVFLISSSSFAGMLLPLVSFVFPSIWIICNAFAYARLLTLFRSSRHLKINDPFDGLNELRGQQQRRSPGILETLKPMMSIFFGTGEYLFRRKNLARSFGSISALGCTDKKGILSWPNKSPEKVFVLTRDRNSSISSEILNITPNHSDPLHVEFDDPSWINFSESLKPIGLNILLNRCGTSTQEKYNNFYYFLKNKSPSDTPTASPGCLCQLSKKIGFQDTKSISKRFSVSSSFQAYHEINNKLSSKVKFPLPNLLSVTAHDKLLKSDQLFSQGSADLLLNFCGDFWVGDDLEPLTEDIRKRILDFYRRASLSSYCTAFSYKPICIPIKKLTNNEEYLRIPDRIYSKAQWNYSPYEDESPQIQEDVTIRQKDDRSGLGPCDCLEIQCNQTFLGMVQLEYQPLIYAIQLIEMLEKACIRFVHFSRENELRSRVFNEKMGLESGWNCHISLKSNTDKKTNTEKFVRAPNSSTVAKRNSYIYSKRSSLPLNPLRPSWLLDVLNWQEGGPSFKFYDEDSTSSKSDDDPFGYEMPNRAQLPTGIENIRPHLQNMDDVPLLVSLFTDCTTETTIEMIKIMQEYEEVVCVFGSSANLRNLPVFIQANASFSIEPLYPQICQSSSAWTPPKNGGPSPVDISRILNSIPNCLSFEMKDEVSIIHLIGESRQFVLSFVNCMKFWICSCSLISTLQFLMYSLSCTPFVDIPNVLWLSTVFVPLLSLSLQGSRPNDDLMLISTGKNIISGEYRKAFMSYGGRFLPSLIILFASSLQKDESCSCPADGLFLEIYLMLISLSCLYPFHQIWRKFYNPLWIVTTLFLLTIRITFDFLLAGGSLSCLPSIPLGYWLTISIGAPLVLVMNECIKYHEIKSNVRHQKRARLDFGTKLGINSPF